MFCKECGAEIPDGSKHCSECGAKLVDDSVNVDKDVVKKESFVRKNKKAFIGCCVGLFVIFVIVAGIAVMSNSNNSSSSDSLNVSDLKFSAGSYNSYDLSCTLIPDKDYNYLEARAIFYDSNGNILDKRSFGLWNDRDLKKGESYKISGTTYCDGNPSKAVIGFYKYSNDDYDESIYNETITF